MTPTRCPTCGAVLDGPEMSALAAARYLRLIPRTKTVLTLAALAREIVERFPADAFTLRLLGVIEVKAARLARSN